MSATALPELVELKQYPSAAHSGLRVPGVLLPLLQGARPSSQMYDVNRHTRTAYRYYERRSLD